MGEQKSKNKTIIVIIAIVLVVIAVLGGIFVVVNEGIQKTIIATEMDVINSSGTIDIEIKSKGKYAEVEKALKDYLVEYQNVAKDIAEEYQNEKFTTILSADNYKNDGPNFEESKKLIEDVKAKGEETKIKLSEMATEEYKEKRATESGLTGKYKELFKNSIKLEDDSSVVGTTVDNVNNYLDKINEVFDFLKEIDGKWEVKDGKIEFGDISNLTKYNSLLTSVNIAQGKLTQQ